MFVGVKSTEELKKEKYRKNSLYIQHYFKTHTVRKKRLNPMKIFGKIIFYFATMPFSMFCLKRQQQKGSP